MDYLFSPSAHGFFVIGIHDVIPSDAVEVTFLEHQALMVAQSEGRNIRVENGKVIADDLPAKTLTELIVEAVASIDARYAQETAKLSHGYPENEQKSWPVQIMESAAVIAGADVDTPWVTAAAAARGITDMELAVKIRDMDVRYRQVSGALTGKRQALVERINLASSPEDVAAIVWDAE